MKSDAEYGIAAPTTPSSRLGTVPSASFDIPDEQPTVKANGQKSESQEVMKKKETKGELAKKMDDSKTVDDTKKVRE